ncbi:hypothetical protein ILUMI_08067 [Ignelater luminosus]|uniref:Uncharacterized protein n=1 Tax=Ignelater luminosus TaxID=2038154 RepID=A0A8K0GFR8_IGNLU|nr:hypothetical protein ILUMI_08067 [Ignelater luminosus]
MCKVCFVAARSGLVAVDAFTANWKGLKFYALLPAGAESSGTITASECGPEEQNHSPVVSFSSSSTLTASETKDSSPKKRNFNRCRKLRLRELEQVKENSENKSSRAKVKKKDAEIYKTLSKWFSIVTQKRCLCVWAEEFGKKLNRSLRILRRARGDLLVETTDTSSSFKKLIGKKANADVLSADKAP